MKSIAGKPDTDNHNVISEVLYLSDVWTAYMSTEEESSSLSLEILAKTLKRSWFWDQTSRKQRFKQDDLRKENRSPWVHCCCLVSRIWLFCNLMDCSTPGSSVRGIFQARMLEWVAISFSRGSSQPRDWIRFSCIRGLVLYHFTTREAWVQCYLSGIPPHVSENT